MAVSLTKFTDPQSTMLAVKAINKLTNGQSTLSFPDGTVASCQPDGTMDFRPAGYDGDYEKCDIDGQIATFWPDHGTSDRYTFAFALVKA